MARKNVAFKIRIDEGLRRAFVDACQADDRPAAQVVREFMRNFVAERSATDHVEQDFNGEGNSPEYGYSRKNGG